MKHSQRPHPTPSAPFQEQDHLQPVQAIRQDTGETIWLVQSRTTPAHYYLLTVDQDTVQCQCQQFRYRGGCAHVGAVRIALRPQQSPSVTMAPLGESLPASYSTSGRYTHPNPRNEQEQQLFEAAERRERALLWTDGKPFSIWKS
jgi:hypothetical protein